MDLGRKRSSQRSLAGNWLGSAALVAVAVLMASSTALAQFSMKAGWDSYGNARFNYIGCYPPKLLTPQGEADNGDGQSFKLGQDKRAVLLWGQYNIDPETNKAYSPQQSFTQAIDIAKQEGVTLSYTFLKGNFFVLTGTNKGKVYYLRSTLKDVRMVSLQFTYPEAMKPVMDPVVAEMSRCLSVGPSNDY